MGDYLKQVIVVRKDLTMPTGKIGSMIGHAAMTFLLQKLHRKTGSAMGDGEFSLWLTANEARWLTELDPGIEETRQISMAKIVCAAENEDHLLNIEKQAKSVGLVVYRVIDSGYSHNKPGTFVCIAIGPDLPEKMEPVTGSLKIYR